MQTPIRHTPRIHKTKILAGMAWLLASLFSGLPPALGEIESLHTANDNSNSHLAQALQSRWIEIDLSKQRLYGWEGNKLVYSFQISTGKSSTPTPKGRFLIGSKYRTGRMRGRDYNIPDVPYVMYFYRGYAIHGAYWHNRFGTPVSHGCVNLRVKQARSLYNWARIGTLVVVHR